MTSDNHVLSPTNLKPKGKKARHGDSKPAKQKASEGGRSCQALEAVMERNPLPPFLESMLSTNAP